MVRFIVNIRYLEIEDQRQSLMVVHGVTKNLKIGFPIMLSMTKWFLFLVENNPREITVVEFLSMIYYLLFCKTNNIEEKEFLKVRKALENTHENFYCLCS